MAGGSAELPQGRGGFWFDGYAGSWRNLALAAVGVCLVGLIGVRVGETLHAGTPAPSASATRAGAPAPKAVLADLAEASRVGLSAMGSPPLASTPKVTPAKPWLVDGKPVVLYIGADYCPFCAAERWPLIVALSRFGTFSHLHLMTSSATDYAPNTPTFTFYGSAYTSHYVHLETVELTTNTPNAQGTYPTLQTPTPLQQATLTKYDAPPYVSAQDAGSIPFLDVANRYIQVGAAYDPTLLQGLTWTQIAQDTVTAAKTGSTSGVGADILRAANVLTAAICRTDGEQPADVCNAAGVRAALGGKSR